jgi:Bacterial protein of unknown function (DUF899)
VDGTRSRGALVGPQGFVTTYWDMDIRPGGTFRVCMRSPEGAERWKHFMLGPGWKEGCVGCSFEVDHIEGALVHLAHHDVNLCGCLPGAAL